MESTDKIYVAGHRGLVGSSIVRALKREGLNNILIRSSSELDLRNQVAVSDFFAAEKPNFVFVAAAKVGGIVANRDAPVEFLYDNMMIEMNLLKAAADQGVTKLLLLGSSCIYPKLAPQPLRESYLLTGPLEATNEAYAIAKIAGLKLAEYYSKTQNRQFISAMPSNIYGPNDNFHPDHSHVIPGLIRRFHEAKITAAPEIVIWGTGEPLREFTYVDDLANACLLLMKEYVSPEFINVGSTEETSIRELAFLIKETVGYEGEVAFDASKPNGTPRKVMDSSRVKNLGWAPQVSLRQGIAKTYKWYVENLNLLRK